jgi:hypothetical protein
MAVICEDVSLLKQVVDDRLSLGKLQRSTMSSLSSSLHSLLNNKHTVAEAASPVGEDLYGNERTVEVSDGNGTADRDISKRQDSMEDGWDFVNDAQE